MKLRRKYWQIRSRIYHFYIHFMVQRKNITTNVLIALGDIKEALGANSEVWHLRPMEECVLDCDQVRVSIDPESIIVEHVLKIWIRFKKNDVRQVVLERLRKLANQYKVRLAVEEYVSKGNKKIRKKKWKQKQMK